MDALAVVIPETHMWAVVVAWIGCYIGGRLMIGGIR